MKSTIQLLAATFGILAIASCTAHVDTPDGTATTTMTTSGNPYAFTETTSITPSVATY